MEIASLSAAVTSSLPSSVRVTNWSTDCALGLRSANEVILELREVFRTRVRFSARAYLRGITRISLTRAVWSVSSLATTSRMRFRSAAPEETTNAFTRSSAVTTMGNGPPWVPSRKSP